MTSNDEIGDLVFFEVNRAFQSMETGKKWNSKVKERRRQRDDGRAEKG